MVKNRCTRFVVALLIISLGVSSLSCRATPAPTATPLPTHTPTPRPTFTPTPVPDYLSLFVLPQDSSNVILDALNDADESIDFVMYLITSRDFIDALKAAEARGVQVRGMMELNYQEVRGIVSDAMTAIINGADVQATLDKAVEDANAVEASQ